MWDVVLIGFPITDLQAPKKRPAVILSSETYNENRPDVILMAITSKIRQPLEVGEAAVADWEQAGLIKPSVFKPLIATIEQNQIVRRIGAISPKDCNTLKNILHVVLDT
ncbi:MAG: type II toxin-antitoxin system PemK/MazF family toxin [Spirochaetaceae bacterium]|nr:MAG: type II toxin-antitoxin system PemK/MazF family toxin [Spirochaetaceae bacterium]